MYNVHILLLSFTKWVHPECVSISVIECRAGITRGGGDHHALSIACIFSYRVCKGLMSLQCIPYSPQVTFTQEELESKLTPEQFLVTQERGTER